MENLKPHCNLKRLKPKKFESSVSDLRRKIIIGNLTKWINGTEIYFFFEGGDPAQREIVREAFVMWKNIGIGINFVETTNRDISMARIGFLVGDGSWSYVGRENLEIPKNKLTMNFGWNIAVDKYGLTTALHEIGHLLGLHHEHQSPFAGIVWNEENVKKYFTGHPNYWNENDINHNILNKMPPNEVSGSAWDPDSIMQYEFIENLIQYPTKYSAGLYPPGILSETDKTIIRKYYPESQSIQSLNELGTTSLANVESGGQQTFMFSPNENRIYTLKTEGSIDSLVVVWKKNSDGKFDFVFGDDDSGKNNNVNINLNLKKDEEYKIDVLVLYNEKKSENKLVIN